MIDPCVCVCVVCQKHALMEQGGPSDHRHAVHPGARQESEGGSTRMLPPVLRQNQGVCVCVCVCVCVERSISSVCQVKSPLFI